jgi:hypothetical protein
LSNQKIELLTVILGEIRGNTTFIHPYGLEKFGWNFEVTAAIHQGPRVISKEMFAMHGISSRLMVIFL